MRYEEGRLIQTSSRFCADAYFLNLLNNLLFVCAHPTRGIAFFPLPPSTIKTPLIVYVFLFAKLDESAGNYGTTSQFYFFFVNGTRLPLRGNLVKRLPGNIKFRTPKKGNVGCL